MQGELSDVLVRAHDDNLLESYSIKVSIQKWGLIFLFYINSTTQSLPTWATTSGQISTSRSFGKCTQSCLTANSPAFMSINRLSCWRVSVPQPLAVEKKVLYRPALICGFSHNFSSTAE